jgi:hypothetical protein
LERGKSFFKEGFRPSFTLLPPSLTKGRGAGGWVRGGYIEVSVGNVQNEF